MHGLVTHVNIGSGMAIDNNSKDVTPTVFLNALSNYESLNKQLMFVLSHDHPVITLLSVVGVNNDCLAK